MEYAVDRSPRPETKADHGLEIAIGGVNRGLSVHRIGTTTQVVNGDKEHIGLIAF